jgi:DNA-binding SARP family transcriptional activator
MGGWVGCSEETLERRSMQIRLLGALEASVDDRAVALGGAKQRAVLAMLALEANHVVTADHLLEGLWGEEPPASAAKMVQNYVWRLRRALGDGAGAAIVTRGTGYELRVDPDCIDVARFERLIAAAGHAAAAGQANGAGRAGGRTGDRRRPCRRSPQRGRR